MERLSLDYPAEVVIEILSWLPIKSVSRFRCVSKPWLHLLAKDPHFTQLYLDRSIGSNRITSILFTPYPPIPGERVKFYSVIDIIAYDEAIELDSSYLPSDAVFIRSIRNGLVFFVGIKNYHSCIWNPLTKDYVLIPALPSSSHFPSCDYISCTGFGYREDTNQCTLITFCPLNHTEPGYMSHVNLYTLGRDSSWRTLENVPYYVGDDDYDAFVSGALHWLAFESCRRKRILAFDIKGEIIKVIPLPNNVDEDGKCCQILKIGELGGLLCVFIRPEPEGENVQIWVMEEYGEGDSWTKKFIIGQPYFCMLGVTHEEEIIFQNYIDDDMELILYNPKTSSVRNKEFGFELCNCAFVYTRSTLSPTLIRGARDIMTKRELEECKRGNGSCYASSAEESSQLSSEGSTTSDYSN